MSQLMNLILRNHKRSIFKCRKDSEEESTILLYAPIVSDDYYGGVSPVTVANALAEIDTPTLHLRINSPGGDVFAGRAIEQLLREYEGEVTVHIDGYAASAASYVALSGKKRIISPGGFFMVHKGWTITAGNEYDLEKTAGLLRSVDKTLVDTYVGALKGVSAETVKAWMDEETWFNSEESVKHGFATSVADNNADEEDDIAENVSDWDLSCYGTRPDDVGCGMPSAGSNTGISEDEYQNLKRRFKYLAAIQQY